MIWNGNPTGVKRLIELTGGLWIWIRTATGMRTNYTLAMLSGIGTLLANLSNQNITATLATGANLYENALNNAHRTIVKTFKY